jgi:ABC-2 type transport system ATP-binding protein
MIKVEQLRKSFGEAIAVDGVTFSAPPGEIFGLLGPNGAGKTTTLNCICGLLTPTSGHIHVSGHDVVRDGVAARRVLGVVPQDLALYEDLTAQENLEYWGGACGMRNPSLRTRARDVLESLGLQDRSKEPVKLFSGGMKRRLNFGCGIMHQPKLLLLDEPTVGVDPQSRVRLLELVREQAKAGACVLYTTHYMEEAETLCDRLAIVDRGKIIAQGTLAELRSMMGEKCSHPMCARPWRSSAESKYCIWRNRNWSLPQPQDRAGCRRSLRHCTTPARRSATRHSPVRRWRACLSSSPASSFGNRRYALHRTHCA